MPGGDGTGPFGMGPMTGRGMGYCAGYAMPGYVSASPRFFSWPSRFFRMPFQERGGGRGWRNKFYATGLPGWIRFGNPTAYQPMATQTSGMNAETEKRILGAQLEYFQNAVDDIRRRLAELDSENNPHATS